MNDPLRDIVRRWPCRDGSQPGVPGGEWLVTNGLGGYASSSVAGRPTRKYHGLLVAALPNPAGRTVMLNHLDEQAVLPGDYGLRPDPEEQTERRFDLQSPSGHLREFRLEAGLPVWDFELDGARLEKRIVMPHRQNTVHVIYSVPRGSPPLRIELRPCVHFRNHETDVTAPLQPGYHLTLGAVHEIGCAGGPAPLRLWLCGADASFTQGGGDNQPMSYGVEQERGYAHQGPLWTPGYFTFTLMAGQTAALVASTEPLEVMQALSPAEAEFAERERRRRLLAAAPPAARRGAGAELVLAADQFVVVPAGRRRDAAQSQAEGDEVRSVIAGYHWFTDWGRDTMISLEGLTLATGRMREAGSILRNFARYVRDGLLPNMFPDGSNEGLYHTADATLWFFHALDRYAAATGDENLVRRLLPTMTGIAEHHLRGTRFGIGVDPADGLLSQGAEGYQLTWMDAKCDGWVVTPRRGKAVEINALWHNALCVLAGWTFRHGDEASARSWAGWAERVRESFNRRFWCEPAGHLYDVVDGPRGDSPECRPNQIFAISLPHPVLDRRHWASVIEVARTRLLTPYGLRSLAPGSPDYAPRYFGSLRQRDAAYHQGTVWAWLIGPWLDAWRRLHPDDLETPRRWLAPLLDHLGDFGLGSIAEVFDAEAPYTARGCIAQAWSVAEVLRHYLALQEHSASGGAA